MLLALKLIGSRLLENWRVIAIASLIVAWSAYFYALGGRHTNAKWVQRYKQQQVQQQLVDSEHARQLRELEAAIDDVEAKGATKKRRREEINDGIDTQVRGFLGRLKPGATDIGPDGVRLVNDAVSARVRAGQGAGGAAAGVPAVAAPGK